MTVFMRHLHRNSGICLDFSSLHSQTILSIDFLILVVPDRFQLWNDKPPLPWILLSVKYLRQKFYIRRKYFYHFYLINSGRTLTIHNVSVQKFPALLPSGKERMLDLLLLVHIFTSLKTRTV